MNWRSFRILIRVITNVPILRTALLVALPTFLCAGSLVRCTFENTESASRTEQDMSSGRSVGLSLPVSAHEPKGPNSSRVQPDDDVFDTVQFGFSLIQNTTEPETDIDTANVESMSLCLPMDFEADVTTWGYFDHDPTTGVQDWKCGNQSYDKHAGTDYDVDRVPIYAAENGEVLTYSNDYGCRNHSWDCFDSACQSNPTCVSDCGCGNGFGNRIYIGHSGGYRSIYAHLTASSFLVQPGDYVQRGQQIALSGASGKVSAPHLHFELELNGVDVDPYVGQCNQGISLWLNQAHPTQGCNYFVTPPPAAVCKWTPPNVQVRARDGSLFKRIRGAIGDIWKRITGGLREGPTDGYEIPVINISDEAFNCLTESNSFEYSKRLVKTDTNPRIYEIIDEFYKREFLNWDAFLAQGYDSSSPIDIVSQAQINSFMRDPFIPFYATPYPDGALVRAKTDTKVYVMSQGRRRWIQNEEVFYAMGYTWDQVQWIDDAVLLSIPGGTEHDVITMNTLQTCGSGAAVPVPSVSVSLPQGRTTFNAGEHVSIPFAITNYVGYDIFFTTDSWLNSEKIFSPNDWVIPNVESDQCAIRVFAFNTNGLTTVTGFGETGFFTIHASGYQQCGDGGCTGSETCSSCPADCGPCLNLIPGSITAPSDGSTVSNEYFEINWTQGYDTYGASTRTALFCRENGGAWDVEAGFGYSPPYDYYDAPVGGTVQCKVRTRLTSNYDEWVDSDVRTWPVSGDYPAIIVTDLELEDNYVPSGCEDVYVLATFRNNGSQAGTWRASGFLHPAGEDETSPDAIAARWPQNVTLDPGQIASKEFRFVTDFPLPPQVGEWEVTVIVEDAYNSYLGTESRLTIPAYYSDPDSPTASNLDIYAFPGTPKEVVPGQRYRIVMSALDDYALEDFSLDWRQPGGAWQSLSVAQQPEGTCRRQFTTDSYWLVPAGLPADQLLDIRFRVTDLAGLSDETMIQVRTRTSTPPNLTFVEPNGGEHFIINTTASPQCAPVEFDFVPGVPLKFVQVGYTNPGRWPLEEIQSVSPIPANGHVSLCLPTRYTGDKMSVYVRLYDNNNVEYYFYSPEFEVDFTPPEPPWNEWYIEPTQLTIARQPYYVSFAYTDFYALRVASNSFSLLRRDYRQWGENNNDLTNDLAFDQLTFSLSNYGLQATEQVLATVAEPYRQGSEWQESNLDWVRPWVYTGKVMQTYSTHDASCTSGLCDYPFYSRDVANQALTSPALLDTYSQRELYERPRTQHYLTPPSGAKLLFVQNYDYSPLSLKTDYYRSNVSGWSLITSFNPPLRHAFYVNSKIWGVTQVTQTGVGQTLTSFEINETTGQTTNIQDFLVWSDENIATRLFQDQQTSVVYLFVSGDTSRSYKLLRFDGPGWTTLMNSTFPTEWDGEPITALYPGDLVAAYGHIAGYFQVYHADGNHFLLARFAPEDQQIDLNEAFIETDSNAVTGSDISSGQLSIDATGRMLRFAVCSWNLETRLCFQRAYAEAHNCEDADLCTVDTWNSQTGQCEYEPVECPSDPNDLCAVPEVCESSSGQCVPDPDHQGCDDGEFCNGVETCDSATGECQSGIPPMVDDGKACTTDLCDEVTDTILHDPNDDACVEDKCNDWQCDPEDVNADPITGCVATPNTIPPDGFACTDDTCDPATGSPVYVLQVNFCLIDDQCYANGATNSGSPCLVCASGQNGYAWSPGHEGQSCNDGSFCTVDDQCANGVCVGSPRTCSAPNSCQWAYCDDVDDTCVSSNQPNGTYCDDGEFCNGADSCISGICSQHAGSSCDAQCQTCNETTNTCDNKTGPCDDGMFCNGADSCAIGACGVHAGDPCTPPETCDETTDECVANDDDSTDDDAVDDDAADDDAADDDTSDDDSVSEGVLADDGENLLVTWSIVGDTIHGFYPTPPSVSDLETSGAMASVFRAGGGVSAVQFDRSGNIIPFPFGTKEFTVYLGDEEYWINLTSGHYELVGNLVPGSIDNWADRQNDFPGVLEDKGTTLWIGWPIDGDVLFGILEDGQIATTSVTYLESISAKVGIFRDGGGISEVLFDGDGNEIEFPPDTQRFTVYLGAEDYWLNLDGWWFALLGGLIHTNGTGWIDRNATDDDTIDDDISDDDSDDDTVDDDATDDDSVDDDATDDDAVDDDATDDDVTDDDSADDDGTDDDGADDDNTDDDGFDDDIDDDADDDSDDDGLFDDDGTDDDGQDDDHDDDGGSSGGGDKDNGSGCGN